MRRLPGPSRRQAIRCARVRASSRKTPNAVTAAIGGGDTNWRTKASDMVDDVQHRSGWNIYKGHILAGLLWMLGAIPVGIFVFLAAFASAGWGLGLFFFYLAAVMLHAYGIEDRVVPPKEDDGEEY